MKVTTDFSACGGSAGIDPGSCGTKRSCHSERSSFVRFTDEGTQSEESAVHLPVKQVSRLRKIIRKRMIRFRSK